MGYSKAVLRGKFIAIQSYLKKEEKSQIYNLNLHLKQQEKEEQTKPRIRTNETQMERNHKTKTEVEGILPNSMKLALH